MLSPHPHGPADLMGTMPHPHQAEEAEFDHSGLWDASPGVCCAAYQLGACGHTEAEADYEEDS